MIAFLTCSSPSPVRSKLLGVPAASGAGEDGVSVGLGFGMGVGVGLDTGVAGGVGVGVGTGVGVAATIVTRPVVGRIKVHTIAPIANSKTTVTPTIRSVV